MCADFSVGQPVVLRQDQRSAQVLRQGLDRRADLDRAFLGYYLLACRYRRVGQIVEDGAAFFAFGVQGHLRVALLPTEAVAQEVRRNGVQPGGKPLLGVEACAVVVNADKGFLGEVGGVGFVVELAHQVVEQALAVALHEGVQGSVMARGQARHVLPILLLNAASHQARV